MRTALWLACLSASALTACGGGAAQATFTLGGKSYAANSIIFGSYQNDEIVDLVVSDSPDLCALLTAQGNPPAHVNLAVVEFKNFISSSAEGPIIAGTYASSVVFGTAGLAAGGASGTTDATCQVPSPTVLDGTVVVAQVKGSSEPLTGSFSLVSADKASSLSGAFTAAYCPKITGSKNSSCN